MADIDGVEAASLAQETSSTLDGSEQLLCFDTATGKRLTCAEFAKWISLKKGSPIRKDVTLNNTSEDTSQTGYNFKQTVAWSGLTTNDTVVQAQVVSGTYSYAYRVETTTDNLNLYFSRQPATSVKIRVWIEKSTVT